MFNYQEANNVENISLYSNLITLTKTLGIIVHR